MDVVRQVFYESGNVFLKVLFSYEQHVVSCEYENCSQKNVIFVMRELFDVGGGMGMMRWP